MRIEEILFSCGNWEDCWAYLHISGKYSVNTERTLCSGHRSSGESPCWQCFMHTIWGNEMPCLHRERTEKLNIWYFSRRGPMGFFCGPILIPVFFPVVRLNHEYTSFQWTPWVLLVNYWNSGCLGNSLNLKLGSGVTMVLCGLCSFKLYNWLKLLQHH